LEAFLVLTNRAKPKSLKNLAVTAQVSFVLVLSHLVLSPPNQKNEESSRWLQERWQASRKKGSHCMTAR